VQHLIKKLLDSFFLLRIPLLAPVWTIFLLGWITGNSHAVPGGFFLNPSLIKDIADAWILLGGFSLVVASIYVVNQIADIESDRINHKLFILPNGFVSIRAAWILAVVCGVSGMSIAFFYGKIFIFFFIASLFLGYLYNLPPAVLKNKAIGGVIANSLGHGMITYLVGWYCAHLDQPYQWNLFFSGVLSSLGPTMANGAVFLATTVPDSEGDRNTGKVTFCVKYGEKTTAKFAAFLCVVSLVCSFFMKFNAWVMIIPALISVIFFVYFAMSTRKELAFRAFKWPVFLLSFAVVVFQPEYGLLIIATFTGSRMYYKWRFNINYPTFKSE
jgi:4-hydroxybenzoate polyprenyltransferase